MKRRSRLRLVGNGEGGNPTCIFDDMDKLRAELAAIAPTASSETPAHADSPPPTRSLRPRRRERETETFARIPDDRGLDLYRRRIGGPAWAALIELDRMVLTQCGKNPVCFWSRRLRAAGLVRGVRTRALRQLAAAGVVEVEWGKRGVSPLVRHLWYPQQD